MATSENTALNDFAQPPRGIRRRTPEMVRTVRSMIDRLSALAQSYGAEERDYATLEQRKHLMRKYGDDERLIYDLKDQGGQLLALRYDLTTQHMLYDTVSPRSKTYQCGKVYRRENTSQTTKRFREFYQFDVDYRGYASEFARREMLVLLNECLSTTLGLSECTIVINDRADVDHRLESAGVPAALHATVCSSVDKYDGNNWSIVLDELAEKGVKDVDRVREAFDAPCTTLNQLVSDLGRLGVTNVRVEPTMVRGLAYYTGLLFEVVPNDGNGPSIAGGGEYGAFIGFSLGLDRLLSTIAAVPKEKLVRRRYIIATEACYTDAIEIAQRARQETGETVDVETIQTYKQIRRTLGRIKKHSPDAPCMIVAERDLERYRETNHFEWK